MRTSHTAAGMLVAEHRPG